MLTKTLTYKVIYSEEDKEYVGLCDQFPGLSWLEPTEADALEGIKKTANEVLFELEPSELITIFSKLHRN